jgi:hypothetical protein
VLCGDCVSIVFEVGEYVECNEVDIGASVVCVGVDVEVSDRECVIMVVLE